MKNFFLTSLIYLSFSPFTHALNNTLQKTSGTCSPAIHSTTGNIELNCNGLSKKDEKRLFQIFNDSLKGFDSLQTIGLLTTILNESRSESMNHQVRILELEDQLRIQTKRIKNILDDGLITEKVKSLIKIGKLNEAEQLVDNNSKQLDKQDEKQAAGHYEAGRIKELRIKYIEAKQHFSKAAALQPYNSTYLEAYGSIFNILGEYYKAIEYYELALKFDLKAYGQDNPKVAINRNNLGVVYLKLGQYDKAIEYLELAVQHGHDAHNNLAVAYLSLGKYNESIKHLGQAINSDLKTYNRLAVNSNTLASIYFKLGQYDKSIISSEHALQAGLKAYGQEHPNIATTYANLGTTYSSLGRYNKAIEYLKLALQANLKIYGEDHPSLTTTYNNLGTVYYSLGQYDKAIKLYNLAIKSDLNTYGKDHPDVATSHGNLGMIYKSLGQYDKAIEYLEFALQSDLKTYGQNNPQIAIWHKNIGLVYDVSGKYDKAIEHYELALYILKATLGNQDSKTRKAATDLALIKEKAAQTKNNKFK